MHLSFLWKLSKDCGNNIPLSSEPRLPSSIASLGTECLVALQPLRFLLCGCLGLAVLMAHSNTVPKRRTGSENYVILLAALSKLSQAKYNWSLAKIQDVLQVFLSKRLRSWPEIQTKFHLEKEKTLLKTYSCTKGDLYNTIFKEQGKRSIGSTLIFAFV